MGISASHRLTHASVATNKESPIPLGLGASLLSFLCFCLRCPGTTDRCGVRLASMPAKESIAMRWLDGPPRIDRIPNIRYDCNCQGR